MPRRKTVKSLPTDSSDDEPLSKKVTKTKPQTLSEESSSESDLENYLHRADKIDLNSSFFNLQKDDPPSFDSIEKEIAAGVSKLSDSGSDDDFQSEPPLEPTPSTSKLNFKQLHEYTKKMEEVKKHVDEYNARKQAQAQIEDISNLLAAGESRLSEENKKVLADLEASLHSSDFESCSDSEKEGWEEVEERQKVKDVIPKEGLQITVEMPGVIRKKKGVDLMAAIKRRINRVKKENQVLVHKVHLLCWLAHGNHVSSVINSQDILAGALSLLPSQQCYPADRTDLKYLEQIVKWYKESVIEMQKAVPLNQTLVELLQEQISTKKAYNKKMLVYIFVAILRSLGIQCRLVLSFQVEPLRPPTSELCSLSTKNDQASDKSKVKKTTAQSPSTQKNIKDENKTAKTTKAKNTDIKIGENKEVTKPKAKQTPGEETKKRNTRKSTNEVLTEKKSQLKVEGNKSRAKSDGEKNEAREQTKSRSNQSGRKDEKASQLKVAKEVKKRSKSNEGEATKRKRGKDPSKIPQLDGVYDNSTDDEVFLQLDGANDNPQIEKPNLKKLKQKQPSCPVKDHPKRLKTKITKYKDSSTESEDDFETRSPFSSKNDSPRVNGRVNLKKLKGVVTKTAKTPPGEGSSEFFKQKTLDVRDDIIKLVKGRIKKQKDIDRTKTVRKRKTNPRTSDEDSDYAPEAIKKKHVDSEDEFAPKVKVKKRVQVHQSEDEDSKKKKRQGVDVWAEVYLESEEKWISVDVIKAQVHCVTELYNRATCPVSYIVAWNNNNTVKDITSRYCKNFNTVTRKLRIDSKWWQATLIPFMGQKTRRDKEEDDELDRLQLEKPLPTSIAEYKDHPLYVLKRHLLKFQAIYPPDAPTLGFVRKEPVYSRQCVYTLHSRDIWLKHAKVVKPGEKPYKIVKARPRWDKLSNQVITDAELEIFGVWQTEDYVPPTAQNGVVPRNAFGNVELFKPCMLPKKTVHLQLPGLNKVAKRMDIDCAPAIVGFDFHGGWSHPTYDGFVVCEEYADILESAWALEQDEIEKREQEKIDKRVYGNWKRLIKGLLIRERLKAKYEFGETSGGAPKKKGKGGPKFATKKRI